MNQDKAPRAAAEAMITQLVSRATFANAYNLSAVVWQPVSATEETTVFMTKSEVEAKLRREKEKT